MLYRFISCSCSSLKELFLVIWFLSFVQWFRIQSVFHLDPWDICLQVEEFRGKENQRRRTSFIKAALKWCTSFLLIFSWWRLLFFFFFSFFFLKDNCFTGFSYFLSNLNMNQPSDQIRSVVQSCPTLCDPMNRSMPGLPVHHQLLKFTQTHVHRVSDAIQPSHPLSSPSPPAPNPSQHQSLFQWVNSSHEVAKVLEFQL